jgi:hypothetical protein
MAIVTGYLRSVFSPVPNPLSETPNEFLLPFVSCFKRGVVNLRAVPAGNLKAASLALSH